MLIVDETLGLKKSKIFKNIVEKSQSFIKDRKILISVQFVPKMLVGKKIKTG